MKLEFTVAEDGAPLGFAHESFTFDTPELSLGSGPIGAVVGLALNGKKVGSKLLFAEDADTKGITASLTFTDNLPGLPQAGTVFTYDDKSLPAFVVSGFKALFPNGLDLVGSVAIVV